MALENPEGASPLTPQPPSTPGRAPLEQPGVAPRAAPQPPRMASAIPESYPPLLRQVESGGRDNAVEPNTKATGRYQFLPSTWAGLIRQHPELGLQQADIVNPAKQELAIRAFTADNARVLQAHNLDVTPMSLYAMHFLGSGAGPVFLTALQKNPNASAAEMFPKAAKYNPSLFYNSDGSAKTLQQAFSAQTQRFQQAAAAMKVNPNLGGAATQQAQAAKVQAPAAPEQPSIGDQATQAIEKAGQAQGKEQIPAEKMKWPGIDVTRANPEAAKTFNEYYDSLMSSRVRTTPPNSGNLQGTPPARPSGT